MPMTTRCPRCGTAFKVVADQLRVRNGLVRCGVCSNIFDGFAAIVGGQDAAAPLASHPAPAPAAAAPVPPPAAGRDAPPDVAPIPPHAAHPGASQTPSQLGPQGPAPLPPHAAPAGASPIPSHLDLGPHHASQAAQYTPSHTPSQQAWDSPARHEEPTPRGYGDPAADAPPAQSLPSPIDTESLKSRPHVPFMPDPNTRPAPRTPYIAPVHQSQPLPPAPQRQGQGPHAVSMPAQPLQSPGPAVLRGRGDARGMDASQGRYYDDLAATDAGAHAYARADADEAIDDRADEHVFLPQADRERHDYDHSLERRGPIFRDPDARDDDYAVVSIPGEARTRYDDSVDAGMAPPQFMDEGVQRRITLIRRLWACGCLLGLIVLVVQWVFVYRTAIVSAVPALRPAFEAVCAPLGCQIGYARRIERISILSSSLQPPANASSATAEGAPTRLVLAVTMRNRYDKPQPWPALALQLTDLSDTVVVRKVLLPQDYLPAGAPAAFAAGGEQVLAVPIQVSGLQVNGYQLDKFFP